MKITESENQLKLFDINPISSNINTQDVVKYSQQSKRKARDLDGAIFRMIEAKRHHEMMSKVADENLVLRIENDKLKQKLKIMQGAI